MAIGPFSDGEKFVHIRAKINEALSFLSSTNVGKNISDKLDDHFGNSDWRDGGASGAATDNNFTNEYRDKVTLYSPVCFVVRVSTDRTSIVSPTEGMEVLQLDTGVRWKYHSNAWNLMPYTTNNIQVYVAQVGVAASEVTPYAPNGSIIKVLK